MNEILKDSELFDKLVSCLGWDKDLDGTYTRHNTEFCRLDKSGLSERLADTIAELDWVYETALKAGLQKAVVGDDDDGVICMSTHGPIDYGMNPRVDKLERDVEALSLACKEWKEMTEKTQKMQEHLDYLYKQITAIKGALYDALYSAEAEKTGRNCCKHETISKTKSR